MLTLQYIYDGQHGTYVHPGSRMLACFRKQSLVEWAMGTQAVGCLHPIFGGLCLSFSAYSYVQALLVALV